jgi:hypothetical protein
MTTIRDLLHGHKGHVNAADMPEAHDKGVCCDCCEIGQHDPVWGKERTDHDDALHQFVIPTCQRSTCMEQFDHDHTIIQAFGDPFERTYAPRI